MKVALVTGSHPPDVCGVGDYTCRLAAALESRGASVEIVCGKDWSILRTRRLAREVISLKADIVHIQYPTRGFGAGLGPQMLNFLHPSVITLHEFSYPRLPRKIAIYPFLLRHRHVIFTSSFERDCALRRAPWIRRSSSVIPIGSNIPSGSPARARNRREIVYFGLIEPRKGLEDVLALASLMKESSAGLGIRVIGMPVPGKLDYLKELKSQADGLPIVWDISRSESEVADLLSQSLIAYVPYPDGASERRGTLLALLSNGVAAVTTRGPHTSPEMGVAVAFAATPGEAVGVIQHLLADEDRLQTLAERARAYAGRFSWGAIADKHIEIYRRLNADGSM